MRTVTDCVLHIEASLRFLGFVLATAPRLALFSTPPCRSWLDLFLPSAVLLDLAVVAVVVAAAGCSPFLG